MIIIAGFAFAVLLAIVFGLLITAKIDDGLDDDIHAPEVEIDRRVTSVWIGGNHFEF